VLPAAGLYLEARVLALIAILGFWLVLEAHYSETE